MTKPDDSTLSQHDLVIIEKRAQQLLNSSEGWDRYPIPIADILDAAKVQVAPTNAFDAASIISYLRGKGQLAAQKIKGAMSKVFGLYDANERVIHIDTTVVLSKQTFLKLHETGHHDIPTHRKMFSLFQDCRETLSPDIADQFEREANNFARYILFKGDRFAQHAADDELGIKTPMKLAKKFGASIYASCREYARTNHRECIIYVLEQPQIGTNLTTYIDVRRIEPSPRFVAQFGVPDDEIINADHKLWPVIPQYRKMTPPTELVIKDLNGQAHECLAEAFDTTYNIIVLVYPVRALTTSIHLSA